MKSVVRLGLVYLFAAAALLGALPARAAFDECDANFIAFLGSDAFQFSPRHSGDLGKVRLYTVLSYQGAAAAGDFGRAFWRLDVSGPEGPRERIVRSVYGNSRIDGAGSTVAEFSWDGRDAAGRWARPGKYHYTFLGRFAPDRIDETKAALTYDDLGGKRGVTEAHASVEELIVDYTLDEAKAFLLRQSKALGACQAQQNTPIEASFSYNFYYGSTHSHSNFSDGGHPTSACSSGNAYGSGTFNPAAVYDYARNSAGLDYWLINEHNHLINDSVATNNGPVTEAKVRQRYLDGRNAANAATVDGTFVALYGMEWGVLTNADQGHVTLIETPKLFGWETCSTCNGPNAECTAGSNCYFDTFTPKRFGYLTMYKRSVENPSPAGALGILCHPSSTHFDGFAFNADADAALQGIAVRSGLAFNTATNCADANVANTDYSPQWKSALNKGFHLGPTADHDAHCNNFGVGLPNRTVYLLPNGTSPALTKLALLQAHKARHFFASEDSNAQLVFASGTHVMGDVFSAAGSATLRVAVYDPGNEAVSAVEVWRGQIGGGVPAAAYRSAANQSTLSFTDSLTSGTYYYYAHAVQADGHDLWSAPMWITYGPGGCTDTTAPAVSVTAPAAGATISCSDTTVRVAATDASGLQSAQVRIDGGTWNNAIFNAGSGAYEYLWASSSATSAGHTIDARATDASCNANVGTSTAVAVTVNNSACATGTDISAWKLVQANSAATFTLPAGTVIPANGYVIVARDATKAAFESFWRGGTALPANVVYVNSAGVVPLINGSETYTLRNASNVTIDGPTVAMASAAGNSMQRINPCTSAGTASNWTTSAAGSATPGTGAGAGCAKGVVINEFADALGTGNFIYEFVELHNDK